MERRNWETLLNLFQCVSFMTNLQLNQCGKIITLWSQCIWELYEQPSFLIVLVGTIITVELNFQQNLLQIIFGSFSLFTGLFIKTFLPENLIICLQGIEIGNFKYYWSKEDKKINPLNH